MKVKNLFEVSKSEQIQFLNSFDTVISDADGVLYERYKELPGSSDCIKALKSLNKNVFVCTNNTTVSRSYIHSVLESFAFGIDEDHIVTPTQAIIWYLKKINFNNEIYVVGTECLKSELRREGFEVAKEEPSIVEETMSKFAEAVAVKNNNVGAVLIDADWNLNVVKLQRALHYVKNPDVIFLTGFSDTSFPFGGDVPAIGPGCFQKCVEDISGRKALRLGKPSPRLCDLIIEKFSLRDPQKILFIGDSVESDMAVAANSGFRKLFVMNHSAKEDDVRNWNFPQEYQPDYYLPNLSYLANIIKDIK